MIMEIETMGSSFFSTDGMMCKDIGSKTDTERNMHFLYNQIIEGKALAHDAMMAYSQAVRNVANEMLEKQMSTILEKYEDVCQSIESDQGKNGK